MITKSMPQQRPLIYLTVIITLCCKAAGQSSSALTGEAALRLSYWLWESCWAVRKRRGEGLFHSALWADYWDGLLRPLLREHLLSQPAESYPRTAAQLPRPDGLLQPCGVVLCREEQNSVIHRYQKRYFTFLSFLVHVHDSKVLLWRRALYFGICSTAE